MEYRVVLGSGLVFPFSLLVIYFYVWLGGANKKMEGTTPRIRWVVENCRIINWFSHNDNNVGYYALEYSTLEIKWILVEFYRRWFVGYIVC